MSTSPTSPTERVLAYLDARSELAILEMASLRAVADLAFRVIPSARRYLDAHGQEDRMLVLLDPVAHFGTKPPRSADVHVDAATGVRLQYAANPALAEAYLETDPAAKARYGSVAVLLDSDIVGCAFKNLRLAHDRRAQTLALARRLKDLPEARHWHRADNAPAQLLHEDGTASLMLGGDGLMVASGGRALLVPEAGVVGVHTVDDTETEDAACIRVVVGDTVLATYATNALDKATATANAVRTARAHLPALLEGDAAHTPAQDATEQFFVLARTLLALLVEDGAFMLSIMQPLRAGSGVNDAPKTAPAYTLILQVERRDAPPLQPAVDSAVLETTIYTDDCAALALIPDGLVLRTEHGDVPVSAKTPVALDGTTLTVGEGAATATLTYATEDAAAQMHAALEGAQAHVGKTDVHGKFAHLVLKEAGFAEEAS